MVLKQGRIIAIALVVLLLFSGMRVVGGTGLQNNYSEAFNISFEDQYNDLAIKLLKHSMTDNGNIVISPLSIVIALSMLSEGSASITKEEFENVLADRIGMRSFQKAVTDLCQYYIKKEEEIIVANSLWINNKDINYSLKQEYRDQIEDKYGADIIIETFNDATAGKVNNWISSHTKHQIENMITSIDEACKSLLVNAIYYDKDWKDEYSSEDIVENGVFFGVEGTDSATYMFSSEDILIETDWAVGFIKPYASGKYGYFALKPYDDIAIETGLNRLTGESFTKMIRERRSQDLRIGIPEYSQDYKIEMSHQLAEIGLSTCFSNGDFSKMISGDFKVNEVLHECHIEVNRQGTKASAATVIDMELGSLLAPEETSSKQIILDRPFVFGVIDMEREIPLFLGVIFRM